MEKQKRKGKRKSCPKKGRLDSVKKLLQDKEVRDLIIRIVRIIIESLKE